MSVSQNALVENGKEIISVRRLIWDMERRRRFLRNDELATLRDLRRTYRRLLAARRALVDQSQMRLF